SKILNSKIKTLTLSDRWILSRLNSVIDSITKKIADYQFGEAGQELYEFVWHEFADWYLEISKFQMAEKKLKNNTIYCLKFIIYNLLKLLHPFIPFVTEEINIHLNNLTIEKNGFLPEKAMEQFNQLLIVANWSAVKRKYINKKIESQFEKIKKIVAEIRNWKSEQKIPFNQEVEYQIQKEEKNLLIIKEVKTLVEQMTKTKLIS
ncbi:MAG: class I tRNA ligase family protein, partial [Patescibacteria group bacterium]|nr:class I tRNA ligase family protein [Patescibacteria group bacterium]